MHIARVYIEGFRRFKRFDLPLNPTYNLIVGNNGTGKSSLLEAIGLVLNGQYDGRLVQYAIDPYLFNAEVVSAFFVARQNGEETPPPRILIEAYLHAANDDAAMAKLKGTNNTKSEDCPGLALAIEVDSNYLNELKEYAADVTNPTVLPIEYFKVTWRSFSGDVVTLRKLPFRATIIDTSRPRAQAGPNKYLANVVSDVLTESQRRDLSLEYKKLRHKFALEPGIVAINQHLAKQGNPATEKKLSVQMDMSYRGSWDSAISPHLDELPFACAGKGEQCRVQLRLAIADAELSRVILLEEPENHLSHANLNVLLNDLKNDCADRQVIITTHSGYVLNKLGLEHITLVSHSGQPATLNGLTGETRDYFKKLPGYNTLRLLLATRCILVEAPSDELVVQRAYKDKHGKLPLEDGVDVISVGALAFKRFLEIAALLKLDVSAVTDNDGDIAALEAKYKAYLGGAHPTIRICFDRDTNLSTLEPQLLGANSLAALNSILRTTCKDGPALLNHMARNKVDCALRLFEAEDTWAVPKYIADAIV